MRSGKECENVENRERNLQMMMLERESRAASGENLHCGAASPTQVRCKLLGYGARAASSPTASLCVRLSPTTTSTFLSPTRFVRLNRVSSIFSGRSDFHFQGK